MARLSFHATLLFAALLFLPRTSAASLLGYWSFDGCTATDASGHSAHLTPEGNPTCVAGRFGSAWSLNGVDQYLDRQFDATFTPGARSWTITLWVNSTSTTPFQVLLEWYRCGANPSCSGSDGADYIVGVANGHPYWDVRDDATHDLEVQDSSSVVVDGQWHFIAVSMNPTADSTKLYVDGALRIARSSPLGTLTAGSVAIPLEVGRHFRTGWGSPDYYFKGAIDEVRIFDEELSAGAVASLFTGNAITAVGDPPVSRLAIQRCWPNPVRGGRALVGFDLPSNAPADLEVFDLAGRRVVSFDGLHGAGPHQIELGEGGALEPGVYLVRLTQAGVTASRRITVLE